MAMNYREFREELLNQLRSIFGENYEIGTQTVQKVNLGNVETFRIFDRRETAVAGFLRQEAL